MSYPGWAPRCAVCKKSVNLTVSKVDEYGQAVHEKCCVSKLLSRETTTSLSEKEFPPRKPAASVGAVATCRPFLAGPVLGLLNHH